MAEQPTGPGPTASSSPADGGASAEGAAGRGANAAAPKQNPAFRAMGLPKLRARLPSRNWLIFFGVVGTWTGALTYDRSEKKRAQRKWCDLVAPLSKEILPTNTMPRRVTIYLGAPPGDGLMTAREHFHEYVKPVLVAAALDWDVVEGRREGDVRAGLAERIRAERKRMGETAASVVMEDEEDAKEEAVKASRAGAGIGEEAGVKGDIVIGRHTWKEYVRGLHEGWLGPLDPPPEVVRRMEAEMEREEREKNGSKEDTPKEQQGDSDETKNPTDTTSGSAESSPDQTSTPDSSSAQEASEQPKPADPSKPKPRRKQPPPFLPASLSTYESSSFPPSAPDSLPPSAPIAFPHLLGFLNTPTRMYRFLTRRRLADDIGRATAAVALGAYGVYDEPGAPSVAAAEHAEDDVSSAWEQERVLMQEEKEWPKSIRKAVAERRDKAAKEVASGAADEDASPTTAAGGEVGGKGALESVWLDRMVLDPRIAGRMRKFIMPVEDEERAKKWMETKGKKE
ncbi:mitochondrial import inner membrane translocase subunit Tim54 [Lineolata rhizophorae]|uniref:Mitochondrial import inner membrane translocase subunit TIM54 n=1 Tax=Lineolata rhizophorae TaxID=578093 RepID=A0A6A6NL82_9PEZI|nr:mitochondrial import inner membrane translocase subunit Tim54 [Lineolata rhizophorae]